MKGILSYNKWYVGRLFGRDFIASRTIDGKTEKIKFSAHCLACAKNDLLAWLGGEVDLRGWDKQGMCGVFLKAMQLSVNEETELEEKPHG